MWSTLVSGCGVALVAAAGLVWLLGADRRRASKLHREALRRMGTDVILERCRSVVDPGTPAARALLEALHAGRALGVRRSWRRHRAAIEAEAAEGGEAEPFEPGWEPYPWWILEDYVAILAERSGSELAAKE